jgi:hypothetical protein
MDSVSAVNIARFDGNNWSPLGAGLNGTISALAVVNGSLYAGGSFTASGATTLNRIARWNGSSWSALGNGLTGSSSSAAVTAIVGSGANLYVGGSFTNAGTVYLAGVAKWDGTAWSALGSGLYNGVFNQTGQGTALALMGNDLYVGGQFTTAGDKPSIAIGRWNDQLNFYPPPHPYLTRQSRLTNGQFQFRLAGTSGERYVLQASTNLSAWTPLLTNSATLYDFTDTTAPNCPWRCYRAVLVP